MKNILIITFSNLKTDARVRRQIEALTKSYTLTVACLEANPSTAYSLHVLKNTPLTISRKIVIGALLLLRQFRLANQFLHPFQHLIKELEQKKIDLIIANDVESLPLAFDIASAHQAKVFFDAHEYAPRHFEDKRMWRLFFQPMNIFICKTYIPKVACMTTVGKGLANEYEKHFAVKPVVITNANKFHDLEPSEVKGAIKLVHHGIATPSRKLELMIEMMNHLDERFTLDMYLLSSGQVAKKTIDYPKWLAELASSNPRVRVLPPIKSEDIVYKLNEYDIGVFLIPPINFNYQNTLPNKLFDFIQARLAIAVGPTPEMAEITRNYNLGVVSDDFTPQGLAEKLQSITAEQLTKYKSNSSRAAKELNAEGNAIILNKLVEQTLR